MMNGVHYQQPRLLCFMVLKYSSNLSMAQYFSVPLGNTDPTVPTDYRTPPTVSSPAHRSRPPHHSPGGPSEWTSTPARRRRLSRSGKGYGSLL